MVQEKKIKRKYQLRYVSSILLERGKGILCFQVNLTSEKHGRETAHM